MYTQTEEVWNQGKIVRNYFGVNINLQPISTTLPVINVHMLEKSVINMI
jgi:hypothetical protein